MRGRKEEGQVKEIERYSGRERIDHIQPGMRRTLVILYMPRPSRFLWQGSLAFPMGQLTPIRIKSGDGCRYFIGTLRGVEMAG